MVMLLFLSKYKLRAENCSEARSVYGVGISDDVNFMIKSLSDKDKLHRGIIDQAASAFFSETRRKRRDFARARIVSNKENMKETQ